MLPDLVQVKGLGHLVLDVLGHLANVVITADAAAGLPWKDDILRDFETGRLEDGTWAASSFLGKLPVAPSAPNQAKELPGSCTCLGLQLQQMTPHVPSCLCVIAYLGIGMETEHFRSVGEWEGLNGFWNYRARAGCTCSCYLPSPVFYPAPRNKLIPRLL